MIRASIQSMIRSASRKGVVEIPASEDRPGDGEAAGQFDQGTAVDRVLDQIRAA
jgi:hypothetical protein